MKMLRRKGNIFRMLVVGASVCWLLIVLSTPYLVLPNYQSEELGVGLWGKAAFSIKSKTTNSTQQLTAASNTDAGNRNKVSSFLNLERRIAHAGPQTAYDENGTLGYIHDPAQAAAQYRDAPFTIPASDYAEVCAAPGRATDEDVDGYRALTQQVHVQTNNASNGRILCILYTYPGGHDRINTIRHTWGRHCDGFLAASTVTNTSAGLVRIPHMGDHETNNATYNVIWQKVRSLFFYVFWNYRDDYDFFHMSGDDAFVIVENLKAYVSSPAVLEAGGGPGWPDPLYIGHWVHRKMFEYAGGGPGYTLNRAGLAGFMAKAYLRCDTDLETPFEDLQFGKCYKRYMKHNPLPALDSSESTTSDGVPLYWGYNPLVACGGATTTTTNGCSPRTVAFHHARTPGILRRWYKLLYRRGDRDCRNENEPGAVWLSANATNQHTKRQRLKASRMSQFQQQAKAEGK